ncbi:MAG: 30S ribosomal protein S6 [Thermomicrobiales bacterium]
MRKYEMMAVLAPDIAEEAMLGELERISGYITTGGGEVTELVTTSPWGRRRLAYPIRDYRDGFYALYNFSTEPEQIDELERELRLNNQVIRSLVTSYIAPKPKKVKPGKEGDAAAEGAPTDGADAPAAETPAAAAPAIAAPSGAAMDTDTDLTTGPDGEDLTEPPTAETPAAEDESEPART